MRDEGRIFPLCMRIAHLWLDHCPDWRFMQLMSNFALWYGADPFYMEDDQFVEKFKEFIDEEFSEAPAVIHKAPDRKTFM